MRVVAACAAQPLFSSIDTHLPFALQRVPLRADTRGMGFSGDPGMTGETAGIYGRYEQLFPLCSMGLVAYHAHAGLDRGMADPRDKFLLEVAVVAEFREFFHQKHLRIRLMGGMACGAHAGLDRGMHELLSPEMPFAVALEADIGHLITEQLRRR